MDLDKTILNVAIGVGKGLGKIENRKASWKWLKNKLSDPLVDTSVTLAGYFALDVDEKLAKKRAPGNWTAAKYRGKTRKVADVVGKSCVVLDLDNITHDQLDDIRTGLAEVSRWAWHMHTTRSHTSEKPRCRLVIPCSRLMSPEEAHAITRLASLTLAEDPDEAIEVPDLVSFRTNQTMFWPSISKGQEFWTDENRADLLDVDAFLEENPEWADLSALPYQAAEKQRGDLDPARKMENPRDKPNPIGAFCRAFTVEDVIERWLSDIYVPGTSETETRYTYALGTGSNGAVVYDGGLFLHSNHGSDPIEGSANAWDLARIHLYGHLDKEAHGNTSPGNLPSYKAMVKLARSLPEVVNEEFGAHDDTMDDLEDEEDDREPGEPKESDDPLGDKLDDLDDADDEQPKKKKKKKADSSWMTDFRRKANGDLEVCQTNVSLICMHDPRIAPCIGYNEFTLDPVCLKPIRSKAITTASREVGRPDRKHGRRWEDADDMAINEIMSAAASRKGYETDSPRDKIEAAVLNVGRQNPIHPVKDFLRAHHERWAREQPSESYLDRLPMEFLGCPDTPFHRASSRLLLVQAVARIFEPGCKVDTMAIVEGPTGSRKSTFWSVLFGGFFTELKADLDKTDRVIENIRGCWAIEMAEMAAAKRADSNTLKSMLSSSADRHRLAYARREAEFPRQSLFVGTSNEDDYLTDPTSTRRFWIWRTDKTEFDPIDIDRLQSVLWIVWGEAVQAYLDMREENPHGALWLDLHDAETAQERDRIAGLSRKRTAVEEIADVVGGWLNEPGPLCEKAVDSEGMTEEWAEGDKTVVVRNMVTAREVYLANRGDPVLSAYRNATSQTYGKALRLVPGWEEIGRVRRHGKAPAVWYARGGNDGPRFVTPEEAGVQAGAPGEDDDLDDLLA